MGFATLFALSIVASSSSVPAAIEAIAQDNEAALAVERLKQAGKPGLWALADAAKKAAGKERGRLFAAVGAYGGPDAEWTLLMELRGSDPEGVVGALRGLSRGSGASVCGNIVRLAGVEDPNVRAAVVEALVVKKGCGAASIKKLSTAPDELSRETALRYVIQSNDPIGGELLGEALQDTAGRVRAKAAELAGVRKERGQLYALSDLARGTDEGAAVAAAQAIGAIGGFSAPAELTAVIADPRTSAAGWHAAGLALRALGKEGYAGLLKAMARAKDPARREALAEIAAHELSDADVLAAVEMLEDADLAPAGTAILDRAGDRVIPIAEERRKRALPELDAGIAAYLVHRAARPTPPDLATAAAPP